MSVETRWCPLCGSEYLAGVPMCVDCLVPLVDTKPLTVDEVGDDDEGQIVYELADLGEMDLFELDQALRAAAIVHAWDGGSLVVRESDEDRVDDVVDRIGRAERLDDGPQVVYEMADFDEEQRDDLGESLDHAGIAHDWDDNGDLVVQERDEERVDVILDALDNPDQLPVDDGFDPLGGDSDGLKATDALSELFVAADRLMHDPEDHEGVLSLVDAARLAESLPVPYGFAPAVWKDLVGQATELRFLLEGDADDDTVIERARELRTQLRQWV
ncbi:MAG: hypothetical protein ACRD0U_06970 [Acidimicrobiales bacterium]